MTALIVSACSLSNPGRQALDVGTLDRRMAALDFVQTIIEIDALIATGSPIVVESGESGFGLVLNKALLDVGIPVVAEGDTRDAQLLSHTVSFSDKRSSNDLMTISMSVDDIILYREYRALAGRWVPDSAFLLRGVAVDNLQINNQLFEIGYSNGVSELAERFQWRLDELADR